MSWDLLLQFLAHFPPSLIGAGTVYNKGKRIHLFVMDLVTTAPSVIYKVHKTNGTVIDLTNPTNLPDPSEIEYMEEPIVSAEIMVTKDFVGPIMELCQERRGRYLSIS